MGGSTSCGLASCTVCGAAASMSSKTSPPRPNRFHCTMGAADPDLSWTSRSPRGVHANRPYPSRGSSEEIRCIPSVLQAASNCERERTLASFASRHFLDGPRLGPPRVSSGSLPSTPFALLWLVVPLSRIEGRSNRQTIVRSDSSRFLTVAARQAAQVTFENGFQCCYAIVPAAAAHNRMATDA